MNPKDELKNQIVFHLRYGKENARTGAKIAKFLKFKDDRPIRLFIREMIAEGVPIASSVGKHPGYFIVSTQEEAEEYSKVLLDRLVADGRRRKDFRIAARKHLNPHQLDLI